MLFYKCFNVILSRVIIEERLISIDLTLFCNKLLLQPQVISVSYKKAIFWAIVIVCLFFLLNNSIVMFVVFSIWLKFNKLYLQIHCHENSALHTKSLNYF